jgi:hypothetical protein
VDWRAFVGWLETWGPRVWPVPIIVSMVALAVAIYSLYVNYPLSRPKLATAGPRLLDHTQPPSVLVYWNNIGKKVAQRGTAVLFTEDDKRAHREQIGEADIQGAGTNVFPGFGGQAMFPVDMQKFHGLFLVCASYFDEAGNVYEQAFLLRLGKPHPGEEFVPLDDMATPDYQVCR